MFKRDIVLEHNQQELNSIDSSSSQIEIKSDSISSSPETYQVNIYKFK